MSAALRSGWPPAAVLLAVALLAELAKASGWLPVTIPAPSQVAATIPAQWADLVWHATGTLRSALMGYALAAAVALALASLALSVAGAERPVLGLGVAIDCFPLIALAPIFVIWLGQGPALYITIAAVAAFFPLLVGLVQGFKSAEPRMRDLFHVMAADRGQRLRLLMFPAALPYIFQAMKIAAPLALLGALIAEWIGAERGLGAMMIYALFSYNVPVVWLTILTLCGLSATAYGLIALAESRVVTWTPRDGGRDG
jgi:ABC-type nitrate/sulfonate/bicarbonate transport system permease component